MFPRISPRLSRSDRPSDGHAQTRDAPQRLDYARDAFRNSGLLGRIRRVAELADTKRRIVDRLKRVESATATDLAAEFGLTDTALRQHLDALEDAGVVTRSSASPTGRGRPPVHWQLAPAAGVFPDRHGELSVDLISTVRSTLGERALDKVIAARSDRQTEGYSKVLAGATTLAERLRRLADIRSEEGYLAEARPDGDAFILIEHHCPIRDAAAACGALCSAELDVFQRSLGNDVTVTRTQHVLAGDRRCAYRVEATPC
jgi:predicted ArsR family transcriptional regulator